MELVAHSVSSIWGVLAIALALIGLSILVRQRRGRLLPTLLLTIAAVLMVTAFLSGQKTLSCQEDLHCWGRKHLIEASFACEEYGKVHLTYRPKWVHNWGSKYKMFSWLDEQRGLLKLTSTRYQISGQPGLYRYECHYDPMARAVLQGITVEANTMAGE